eukprot:TRINITY_DN19431_c0_g2_i1.p1 TRINITY_DN19431_c0_g2~~TRINITY_DN19431_c0_g2_i1.p1  ORF type:complete len:398 (+),score=149.69 TRINITY_DN19431_c0_g2_i1:75-1196(+)
MLAAVAVALTLFCLTTTGNDQKPPRPPPADSPPAAAAHGCAGEKADYESSEWEQAWLTGIQEWSQGKWTKACGQMVSGADKVLGWLDGAAGSRASPDAVLPANVFSRHKPTASCARGYWLEPLVGHLRDPRWYCGGPLQWHERNRTVQRGTQKRHIFERELELQQRVDWIVLPWAKHVLAPGSRAFLFDVGAKDWGAKSLMQQPMGGGEPARLSSMEWLWEEYARRGIRFERILAWDFDVDPKRMWEAFPDEVRPYVSYHTYAVSAEPDSKLNPFYFVRKLCRPEDYVVMKLDIDTPHVEIKLTRQLLAEQDLGHLVDEFFWEHHTSHNPMVWNRVGWSYQKDVIDKQGMSLTDSYHLFHRLRQAGIRAHSWV